MKMNGNYALAATMVLAVFHSSMVCAQSSDSTAGGEDSAAQQHHSKTPDIRGSEMKLKAEKGNFVAVPIPFHNPALDWGLVLGAAYFYGQSEAQKKAQPASVTGIAAMYTQNHSWALGVGHESYWDEDKWRFAGAIGVTELDLELLVSDNTDSGDSADWLLDGGFAQAQIQRRISSDWYLGLSGRVVDLNQDLALGILPVDLGVNLSTESKAVGLGLSIERDSRDMPTNPYSGSQFTLSGLFNEESLGSDSSYEKYQANYSSYHKLAAPVVLAWQVSACMNSGTAPLWDACRVGLRGFSATDYMGAESALGQVEARWQISKRWGAVAFAGVGYMNDSVSGLRDNEAIPSYGVGARFMVMQAKRINVRIDYGRSNGSSAWYLSAGEAF